MGKIHCLSFVLILIILLTPDMRWGETRTLTHSLTRAVGVLQFHSFLILPRVSAGAGLSPIRMPPLQMPVSSSGAPGYPKLLSDLATNPRFTDPLLRFGNLLEWLILPRKTVHLSCQLIAKAILKDTREQPDEDTRGQVWKGSEHRAPVPREFRCVIPCPRLRVCSPTWTFSEHHNTGCCGGLIHAVSQ